MPASVSAGVVLVRAAAARPRRPDCCQPKSGVPTPEGSTVGRMKAKLRTRQKTAGGHSPRTPRGKHHKGGNTTRGNPPANTCRVCVWLCVCEQDFRLIDKLYILCYILHVPIHRVGVKHNDCESTRERERTEGRVQWKWNSWLILVLIFFYIIM